MKKVFIILGSVVLFPIVMLSGYMWIASIDFQYTPSFEEYPIKNYPIDDENSADFFRNFNTTSNSLGAVEYDGETYIVNYAFNDWNKGNLEGARALVSAYKKSIDELWRGVGASLYNPYWIEFNEVSYSELISGEFTNNFVISLDLPEYYRWLSLDIMVDVADGKLDEAAEKLLKLQTTTHSVLKGNGLVLTGLVHINLDDYYSNALLEVAKDAELLSDEKILRIIDEIDLAKGARSTLAERSFNIEYHWGHAILDALSTHAQQPSEQTEILVETPDLYKVLTLPLIGSVFPVDRYSYKVNETKRLYAQNMEYIRPFFHGSCVDLVGDALPTSEQVEQYMNEHIGNLGDEDQLLMEIVKPNFIGRSVVSTLIPRLIELKWRACRAEQRQQIVKLIFHIKQFQKDNRLRLPESLQELVPEYIDVLPVDPISGELFIYNRDMRYIAPPVEIFDSYNKEAFYPDGKWYALD